MNWTKQYPGWTMFGAMVGLLIFLGDWRFRCRWRTEPIGPAANEFAAGARITVLLTLISGTSGIVLGFWQELGKLSVPAGPLDLRFLCLDHPRHAAAAADHVRLARRANDHAGRRCAFRFRLRRQSRSRSTSAPTTPNASAPASLAVPHGQVEAARALGLSPMRTFIDIVLPQSLRVALPALANNLASLVKDSSSLTRSALSN